MTREAPHPHPLPTKGEGRRVTLRAVGTGKAGRLPPPVWGRDGVGGPLATQPGEDRA